MKNDSDGTDKKDKKISRIKDQLAKLREKLKASEDQQSPIPSKSKPKRIKSKSNQKKQRRKKSKSNQKKQRRKKSKSNQKKQRRKKSKSNQKKQKRKRQKLRQ